MDEPIKIEYHGKIVETGKMDAYLVGNAIIGFNDFTKHFFKIIYGTELNQTKPFVKGFENNCFSIWFTLLQNKTASLITTAEQLKSSFEHFKMIINLFKHLRGEPPKNREIHDGKIAVTNNQGTVNIYNQSIIQAASIPEIGQGVEKFIGKPLAEGLDNIKIVNKENDETVTVKQSEGNYFKPIIMEELFLEQEYETGLIIESPNFKDGNKWKVSDGSGSFFTSMLDEDFKQRIDHGERFGKGDVIRVKMRAKQFKEDGSFRNEREILKVIQFVPSMKQTKLIE